MSDIVISVRNVSKCYRVFDDQRSRLLHAIWPKYNRGVQEVWALKDINFEIRRGEAVAIIGRNGGGKSTLLEILTGTLQPTSGEVTVNGRVSALLELGSGFNPEYSGRDNVLLNGLLLGLTREEIVARFAEIEAFAEIGAAIDRPVKTYSSGMMMRLAFAVQVLCEPDILIIDEALSVGDFFFQQKCLTYIRKLRENGVTLLFVSHDMGTVRDICDRAIYLNKGCISQDGDTSAVISRFIADASASQLPSSLNIETTNTQGIGETCKLSPQNALWFCGTNIPKKEGELLSVAVTDSKGNPARVFKVGDECIVSVVYASDLSNECHAGLSVINKYGHVVTVTGSYFTQTELPRMYGLEHKLRVVTCSLKVTLLLESGQYSLDISTGITTAPNRGVVLDRVSSLGPITVTWDHEQYPAHFLGQVGLPVTCTCSLIDL